MSFYQYYQTWFEQLHHLVDQLSTAPNPPTTPDHHDSLLTLVHKVLTHYSDYYRIKQLAAHSDVLSLFSAPWFTSLERSLHWAAGWRPTTLFHLVLTQSSILFESRIVDILRGLRTGDLGDLSPTQFARLSDLQCETVREENAITDELSEWQDGASELLSLCSPSSPSVGSDLEGKIVRRDGDSSDDHLRSGADLEGKIRRLVRIVEKADDLRLRTIRRVVELLTPQQAVEFLIAAAELQFGVREWGLNHDRRRGNF